MIAIPKITENWYFTSKIVYEIDRSYNWCLIKESKISDTELVMTGLASDNVWSLWKNYENYSNL